MARRKNTYAFISTEHHPETNRFAVKCKSKKKKNLKRKKKKKEEPWPKSATLSTYDILLASDQKTPARCITSRNCSWVTPAFTPAPPFASWIISLRNSSVTLSSFSSRAIRRSWLNVIGPSLPYVKSRKAESTSAARVSALRECSLAAAAVRKVGYVTWPVEVGSTAERMEESSDGDSGGRPRALKEKGDIRE